MCLNNSWINLNLLEYAGICVNMPKPIWMAFVLYFPNVILCLVEQVVTYLSVYTKPEIKGWKKQNMIFSTVAGSIWFAIYIRLNNFTNKILKCLLPLRAEEAEGRGPWIFMYLVHFSILISVLANLNCLAIFKKRIK